MPMCCAEAVNVLGIYGRRILGATFSDEPATATLEFEIEGMRFQVRLAKNAKEWYFDAYDVVTKEAAHDWYDYTGYGPTSVVEIERDIAADVENVLRTLTTSSIRFCTSSGFLKKARVEFLDADQWKPVIPRGRE